MDAFFFFLLGTGGGWPFVQLNFGLGSTFLLSVSLNAVYFRYVIIEMRYLLGWKKKISHDFLEQTNSLARAPTPTKEQPSPVPLATN